MPNLYFRNSTRSSFSGDRLKRVSNSRHSFNHIPTPRTHGFYCYKTSNWSNIIVSGAGTSFHTHHRHNHILWNISTVLRFWTLNLRIWSRLNNDGQGGLGLKVLTNSVDLSGAKTDLFMCLKWAVIRSNSRKKLCYFDYRWPWRKFGSTKAIALADPWSKDKDSIVLVHLPTR